jgi:hypothetical protein
VLTLAVGAAEQNHVGVATVMQYEVAGVLALRAKRGPDLVAGNEAVYQLNTPRFFL